MVKTKKLLLPDEQLRNLPVFYNFVLYNKLIEPGPLYRVRHSEKLSGILLTSFPDKPLSKIIDYSEK